MTISFSDKQTKTIRQPFDYNLDVLEGTPRSGKTLAGIFRYARYLVNSRDENHLIIAYNQEQAYRLFIEGDGKGLKHIFGDFCRTSHDENGDHLQLDTPRGLKKIFYKGGGKADSKKAITGMSLGSVVFCEIDLLHMDMIQECFRRTFAAKDRYHLADLNPPPPHHPVIQEVFDVQKTRWQHWTIDDNPIITDERKAEIYDTLKKNPYLYKRDWLGQRVMPQGVIYSMFDMDKHQLPSLLGQPYEMYFVADGGQSDATSCSCNIVTRYKNQFRINRVAHYYHSGADTGQTKAMSVYAKEIDAFMQYCINKYQMRYTEMLVDPSCKSLKEELDQIGIDAENADNNGRDIRGNAKGIEVGIERTQNAMDNNQFFLIDDKKYDHYHFIKEIGMFVRDDHGKPVDGGDDSMDELRYSINKFYKDYIL